jgi:hypothetical protein
MRCGDPNAVLRCVRHSRPIDGLRHCRRLMLLGRQTVIHCHDRSDCIRHIGILRSQVFREQDICLRLVVTGVGHEGATLLRRTKTRQETRGAHDQYYRVTNPGIIRHLDMLRITDDEMQAQTRPQSKYYLTTFGPCRPSIYRGMRSPSGA